MAGRVGLQRKTDRKNTELENYRDWNTSL